MEQPTKQNQRVLSDAAAIERDGDTTTYEVAIPWDAIEASPDDGTVDVAIIVNDDDGSGREGYLWWGSDIGSSKDPATFQSLTLVEAGPTGEETATAAATPSPEPTEATEEGTATPTQTETPGDGGASPADTTTPAEPGETTPGDGPGFTLVAALLAIVLAVSIRRYRH
jgi:hypothetical protein